MAENECRLGYITEGCVLLWRVLSSSDESALQIAERMGTITDANSLGSWAIAEIGLGGSYWFDVVLSAGRQAAEIEAIYGTLPYAIY